MTSRWDRYWFAPAHVLDLAIARWVVVGVQQIVLLFPHALLTIPPYTRFEEKAALPFERFEPALVFRLLTWPLGLDYKPTAGDLYAVYYATIAIGFLALLGLRTRTCLLLYTAGIAFMISHSYGYGEYHHIEVMPVIALGLLACSPSGRALSLDAWRAARRARRQATASDAASDAAHVHDADVPQALRPATRRLDPMACWPGRLMACVFSVAYLSAGLHKLGGGGLDWLNGYTLQAYLLQDALYWNIPAGQWLGQQHTLVWLLGWFTIVFEVSFPLVLLARRITPIYVIFGCAFHMGIWVTMRAPFMLWLPAYALLLPWTAWWLAWRTRAARPATATAT